MRDNVKHFLQLLTEVLDMPGPLLEVGALQAEGPEAYADMRPYFPEAVYLGADMQPGPGVDCRVDAHRLPLRDATMGTVLLLDTLEHVQSPLVAVQEACRVLKPDGVLVVASVMNFPIHGFPSDYWRFTPAAVAYLLAPLLPRFVYSQGDAEFPHTVIGLGMRPSGSAGAEGAFSGGVREAQTRWPESLYGGPLLPWEPSVLTLSQRLSDGPLPELTPGRTIAQSFVCPNDNLSRIDVRMSNLGQVSASHALFRLREDGESGREVTAYRLFAPHVIDGGWTFVPVPVQAGSAGRRYVLSIESPDGAAGQTVTALASSATRYEDGQLSIDGEPIEGSLCFQVYCRSATEEVSGGARGESLSGMPDAGAAPRAAPDAGAAAMRAEERGWEQARYLASVVESGFDALHADLRALQARLEALERVQEQALEQSTEAAALSRAVRRNPFYRIWKRLLG